MHLVPGAQSFVGGGSDVEKALDCIVAGDLIHKILRQDRSEVNH
jgi:hypothetical protein